VVHRRLDLGGGGEVLRPADGRSKSKGGEAVEERTAVDSFRAEI